MIEPPPSSLHMRAHGLRGEELVAQVDVLRPVPVFRRDVVDRVALVIGGVVDEHGDRAEFARATSRSRPAARRCREIACEEQRRVARARESAATSAAPASRLDVDEGDAGAVARERLDDGGADAGTRRR